jgi:hypothetical protein
MKRSLIPLAVVVSSFSLFLNGAPGAGGRGHGGGGWGGGGGIRSGGGHRGGGGWGGGGHSFVGGHGSAAGSGHYSGTHRAGIPSYSGAPRGGRTYRPRVGLEPGSDVSRRHDNRLANRNTISKRDGRRDEGNWSRHNSANSKRFDKHTQDRLRNWHGRRSDFAEARQRHHHKHDHEWWHHHCAAIILVGGGYWGWWDGWWYPAWGYDSYYSYYEYDGPIYGYDGLPPDETVANVQRELQRLGYYSYAVDGILGTLTQDALARYQRDHQLPITRTIDPGTVKGLGLT